MRRNDREVKRKLICGIGALLIFITAGIFAAETQLNALTLESGFAKVLNLKRDRAAKNIYLYCLGEQVSLGEWEVPMVEMKGNDLVVQFGGEKKAVLSVDRLRDMRKTVEKYYGSILEDLNY